MQGFSTPSSCVYAPQCGPLSAALWVPTQQSYHTRAPGPRLTRRWICREPGTAVTTKRYILPSCAHLPLLGHIPSSCSVIVVTNENPKGGLAMNPHVSGFTLSYEDCSQA